VIRERAGEPVLRGVTAGDLAVFYEQQRDAAAIRMAAFTARDPSDRAAFDLHWRRILGDPNVWVRTIELRGAVAGHVAVYGSPGEREVTYWLGRPFWGRGIATRALMLLLLR
jgi:RimJ/RimL family protein N-acetyltransferase